MIQSTTSKCGNLRLSLKMIKFCGIEDHLINRIGKINGIGYFIEDIEQTHQFDKMDEKRTKKIRNILKTITTHSTMEWATLNGEIKRKNQK